MKQQTQTLTEINRLRSELIHSRGQVTELQEELKEKTNLYINAISERNQYKERLNNAKQSINRVDNIVESKVNMALEKERAEYAKIKEENMLFKQRIDMMDDERKQMEDRTKTLMDKIQGLSQDLAFYARNVDARESMKRIEALRDEKDQKERTIIKLTQDLNDLSNKIEDFMAENSVLRKMANVPKNYGINREQVKLHDREKIDDYKKLIRVLQDDNYKLEEERARLKHMLKQQSMMYKQDPSQRYKDLTQEQIFKVDQFVLKLISGETEEPADYYKLKKENQNLKTQLKALDEKGFDLVRGQLELFFKDKEMSASTSQLQQLLSGNESIINLIKNLKFAPSSGGDEQTHGTTVLTGGNTGQYRPPMPHAGFDGDVSQGFSYKFKTHLEVVDKNGKPGLGETNRMDVAFLQLQLVELFEIIKRKDENISNQEKQINLLYKRVRDYLLIQDQLYKDYVKLEKDSEDKQKKNDIALRNSNDRLLEEQIKIKNLEDLLKSLNKSDKGSIEHRLIELTKQNSILDINLLRTSRRLQTIEEQEQILRREYHNQEAEMSEKDRFIQSRINSLKEWKARAIQQLKFLFQKLRLAVPISEYQSIEQELDIFKNKNADFIDRNARMAEKLSKLQTQVRENQEDQTRIQSLQEQKDTLENEFDVISKRLETCDQNYKWEVAVFNKIVAILKRVKVSPIQAFEEFDKNRDGKLGRDEFSKALDMMKINDLSNKEIDILVNSLDQDLDGYINYKEFLQKLSRHGIKSRTSEEQIIHLIIESLQRSKVKNLSEAFQLIDKEDRGIISRDDFRDIFKILKDKIDPNDIEKFIDNFWKDKAGGIDYQSFLRIFNRYQVRLDESNQAKQGNYVRIPDEIIRLKKKFFGELDYAFKQTGKSLKSFFKSIDVDGSQNIDLEEFTKMFEKVNINLNSEESKHIFNSIDFDYSGTICWPELSADFEHCIKTDVETLIREQREKSNQPTGDGRAAYKKQNEKQINEDILLNMPQMTAQNMESHFRTRIAILEAREKQNARRLETQNRIQRATDNQKIEIQSSYDLLEKKWNDVIEQYHIQQEQIRDLQQSLRQSINKDEAERIKVKNESLTTELTETKAAMISYKNMTDVISDQVKALKMTLERKKDENENLVTSIRELQSMSVDQQRLGKLYYIVMLSRWQEAAVNKKYDLVLSENKELRKEILNVEQLYKNKEYDHHQAENVLQTKQLEYEKLSQVLSSTKSFFLTLEKAEELNRIITEVTDDKTDLEEKYFYLRSEFLTTQFKMDEAQSKATNMRELLDTLKNSKPSELSDRLIDLSQKLQGVRLKELRSSRENQAIQEKNTYISRLLKNNVDHTKKLEEQVSELESKMHKREEEFRRADNDRMKKFFNARFDDIPGALKQPDPYMPKPGFGQQIVHQPTYGTKNSALDTINQDTILEKRSSQYNESSADIRMLEGQVKRLKDELKQAVDQIKSQDNIINRFKEWQLADQYLAQDEQLKDAIDSHKVKRDQVHEQESKEMAEAAYTTIKTLQEMLDQKNQQLRHKEELIQKYTVQMAEQREHDAIEIAKLQQQASLAAGTTLNKLQEIVARDHEPVQQTGYGRKYDRLTKEELQKTLEEKDQSIQQLQSQKKAVEDEKKLALLKKQEANDRILDLETALTRADKQVELKQSRKELTNLKKELQIRDKKHEELNKVISELRDRMINYEKYKSNHTEDDKMRKVQEQTKETEYKRQLDELKQKYKLMETQRNQRADELKQMKIKDLEISAQQKNIIQERDDARKALGQTNERIQKEMNQRQALQNEVNILKSQQQIGKDLNVGGPSVESLMVRNKELENDILILQCQQKTVIVYNKETGTFEFIGDTMFLPNPDQSYQDITEIDVFIKQLELWLNRNPRLTVQSIFEAQDKHNFGELTEMQYEIAFNKIGLKLRPKEKSMLKELLDPKSSGYIKYRPLVSQINGVPQIEFMQREILKLAKLVEARDLSIEMFKQLMDPKKQENLSFMEFQDTCKQIKSENFQLFDQEVENVFKFITKTQRTTGVQISITKLSLEVFTALRALLIEQMKAAIIKTMKPLSEIFSKYDANKDGFLEYNQLESLLLDQQLAFKPNTLKIVFDIFDPNERHSKINYQNMKFYVSDGSSFKSLVSEVPGGAQSFGSYGGFNESNNMIDGGPKISQESSNEEMNMCRQGSRKILSAMQGNLLDLLSKRDIYHEGIIGREDLQNIIREQKIPELTQGEMALLLKQTDRGHKGYVSISHFVEKLHELSAETKHDIILRRFGNTVKHQGINLRAEFAKYDGGKGQAIDKKQFQRCLRGLSIALTEEEIELLFQTCEIIERKGWIDVKYFINRVTMMQKQKPLPTFLAQQPNTLAQGKTQAGKQGGQGGVFENWEAEKKYKKKLEALQQQIEESKKETQAAEKQSKHWQEMANRLERDKNGLQTRLVDLNTKPSKTAMYESLGQGQIEEIQNLKDQVFYLQDLNMKLEKTLQVDLKSELIKVNKEKDKMEDKNRSQAEIIKRLEYQVERLVGKPPMDQIEAREEGELWRESRIQELEKECGEREKNEALLNQQLFKSEETVLDLKFQKETFDLQYARLQKRITDLEQYKLASSQYSAVLKKQDDEEKKKIDEISLNGLGINNQNAKKDLDSTKVRSKSSKSVLELETLVEALKRVVEKQKTEIESLHKRLAEKEREGEKRKNEKILKQKIENLEQEVHTHEMKEINLDGKDKTIKKILESNKMLREDLKVESERYQVLEKKYKEILIKYNVLAKEHATNVEKLFVTNTGGQLKNYDKYLERDEQEIGGYFDKSDKKWDKGGNRGPSYERQFEDVF